MSGEAAAGMVFQHQIGHTHTRFFRTGARPRATHMAEAVRMVIWDLDETFWIGTLTEGGIKEIPLAHKNVVTELAKRGILSSICSKNDCELVKEVLKQEEIWDYFIFPSIEWTPKSYRISSILTAVQLRAESVLFIDDNPSNLAEVHNLCPGIQLAGPDIIKSMLDDHMFAGKEDDNLTRLKQYKILEQKAREKISHGSDVTGFLRESNIRVFIEHDVHKHIDRAIELINRTNQLNYTKRRLPENSQDAARVLLKDIGDFTGKAGLIKAWDNYGDYGYIGFYAVQGYAPNEEVVHLCFSCRTLGMGIENWIYDRIGRPHIQVQGEVIVPLTDEEKSDWIVVAESNEGQASPLHGKIPKIRLRGECEVNALSHYFSLSSACVEMAQGTVKRDIAVRGNASANVLAASQSDEGLLENELTKFGLNKDDLGADFFQINQPGSVLIFSMFGEYYNNVLKNTRNGVKLSVSFRGYFGDIINTSPEKIVEYLISCNIQEENRNIIMSTYEHMRSEYENVQQTPEEVANNVRLLAEQVSADSFLFVLLPPHQVRRRGLVEKFDWIVSRNQAAVSALSKYENVFPVLFDECIFSPNEVQEGWFHFDRTVYYRVFARIEKMLKGLLG